MAAAHSNISPPYAAAHSDTSRAYAAADGSSPLEMPALESLMRY